MSRDQKQIEEGLILANTARRLCEEDRADEAWGIAETLMERMPHSANPVILGSYVAWKMRKMPLAYQLGIRGTQMAPQEAIAFLNLGMGAQEIWLMDEAIEAYRMAERLAKDDKERGMALLNLSAVYVDIGEYTKAEEHARKALKLIPDNKKAKANLGFAMLGQKKWAGWDWYAYALGLKSRRKVQFAGEGDWDGTKGLTVAAYGEQGLGDELSFACMIPQAVKDCGRLIIECDSKLEGLFQRSFPTTKVYGTRTKAELTWAKEDQQIDASIALGDLGKFYRTTDEDFTGEPYLVADPERRAMWKSLFANGKKPAIGIAWSGGVYHTGEKFRKLTLEQLSPLLTSVKAKFVSLQYKDSSEEIREFKAKHPEVDISQYAFGTLTSDYDDTAALVAELDLVIGVDTSVIHLAGALGKECWLMLHKYSQFRWGMSGSNTPWYKSIQIFRQRSLQDWGGPIGEVIHHLRQRYKVEEKAAA